MDSEKIAKAKEFLQRLEIKTSKSQIAFAKRVLCAQQFLAETKKQIEISV